ncbi:hypothetical protein [Rhodocyclus tenuis]|uniref:Uncharacterized protein n=1 Tax=Rhodocyclus tenuis TaxID=1066 RepID=A0A840G6X2_RHOTE|nr:hypothetical protein [Rhodocyclus tenuis]MBB4247625.1 hypothetical protein [Rhodocyclus tenuis]
MSHVILPGRQEQAIRRSTGHARALATGAQRFAGFPAITLDASSAAAKAALFSIAGKGRCRIWQCPPGQDHAITTFAVWFLLFARSASAILQALSPESRLLCSIHKARAHAFKKKNQACSNGRDEGKHACC